MDFSAAFCDFAGNYKQTAVEVSQSLPQGCPLSPWALNVVLCTPAKLIRSNHRQCVHVTYVDDRSFAARSLGTIQSIWNQWREHTAALGLEESVDKTQITCRTQGKKGPGPGECQSWPVSSTPSLFWELISHLGTLNPLTKR